jgi:hypothetical protein
MKTEARLSIAPVVYKRTQFVAYTSPGFLALDPSRVE